MHYLWYDCETGGFDEKKESLLTAYFAICNEDLTIIDDLNLQLRPENPADIRANPGALKVNGINLEEHLADPNTVTYEEGRRLLIEKLTQHKIKGKRKHFRPCGHNIDFDNRFLFNQMIPKEEWEKLVHYHQLDTTSVTTVLKDWGFMAENVDGRLIGLAEYFEIPVMDAHSAMGDVRMNIEVYKRMQAMGRNAKKNVLTASTSNNLLKIIEA